MASQEFLAAIDLVANPETWTTGAFARSAKDRDCKPRGKAACKWCAMGAMEKTGVPGAEWTEFHNFVHGRVGNSVPFVNDYEGREAILSLMQEFAGV